VVIFLLKNEAFPFCLKRLYLLCEENLDKIDDPQNFIGFFMSKERRGVRI